MQTNNTTEQQIIAAARKIFVQKGLAGARMQDIADEAGINKAMLHYYYRSKDRLFEIVFEEAVGQLLSGVNDIFQADMTPREKIVAAVDHYITSLGRAPYLPLFVVHEISQNPERILQRFASTTLLPNIGLFLKELAVEMEQGRMRKVDPWQLMVSLISMCVFPFVGKPLLQAVFQINDKTFAKMMEERKHFITDFVLTSLEP
ncbi:TetR/AcrR family transcriptional regulator [Chitinophaga sp. XS-30]|uniref:TetR/AcrR family transcriptional regulator n=1 Tax=Chitinophaga sp. XS-30 TaxID=2604421 RepID=UPI0011DC99F5|nr:TetR/AcrR family transcriptional regulator [Chitinophaga sp. XS-30]QEH41893.1 TetR/AcrR family transcriptional regulator [Chitinophaga sp. XS-30]